MSKNVFAVQNGHVENCGEPPTWLDDPREPGERRQYFENQYGEQWIAFLSPTRFRLTGGDFGWKTLEIMQPDYDQLIAAVAPATARQLQRRLSKTFLLGVHSIGLNSEEQNWLFSAFKAIV